MAGNLLFYFKFNEYVNNIPLTVDYSGRKNDGVINGSYTVTHESAIDQSGLTEIKEQPVPVFISVDNSRVDFKEWVDAQINKGTEHDIGNSFNLYQKFPDWIKEEEQDLGSNHLLRMVNLISTYFDGLYHQVKDLSSYRHQKITPSEDKEKIYPFYDKILSSTGFDVTDLFTNLSITEKNANRNDTVVFQNPFDNKDISIDKVKNAIYQNIYNNLSYILKSKGTERSIKSLLRSYGVDENLIKVNLYGDQSLYNVADKSTERIVKKKIVKLQNSDNVSVTFSGTGYGSQQNLTFIARCLFNEELPLDVSYQIIQAAGLSLKIKNTVLGYELYLNNNIINASDKILSLKSDTAWLFSLSLIGNNATINAINYKTSTDYEIVRYTGAITNRSNTTGVVFGGNTTKLSLLDCAGWLLAINEDVLLNQAKDITNYGIPDFKRNYDKNIFYVNFENVLKSDSSGNFSPLNLLGSAIVNGNVSYLDSTVFLSKEELRTYKKLNFETLNGIETIQVLEEDNFEERAKLKKPSKLQLLIENSMYQIISEEMINMFYSISEYVESLTYTGAKYDYSYKNIDFLRQKFFEKVSNKIDVEKYIEFYRWIDSGLDSLLRQLVPESANNASGLKNTIESHMLERNKYKNQFPVWGVTNKFYSSSVAIIGAPSIKDSDNQKYVETVVETNKILNDPKKVGNISNILGLNYLKNLDFIQTAGIYQNNTGKSEVIGTYFSSGDGAADSIRTSGMEEYSIYNSLLNRNKNNVNWSVNSIATGSIYENNGTASQSAGNYLPIGAVKARRDNNYLYSNDQSGINLKYIEETPIEYCVPATQTVLLSGANIPMELKSPYDSGFDLFTPGFYENYNEYLEIEDQNFKFVDNYYKPRSTNSIYNDINILRDSGSLSVLSAQKLINIFPKKEYMGNILNTTKPTFVDLDLTKNTNTLKTYWRNNINDRHRPTSSYNNLGFLNTGIGSSLFLVNKDLNNNSGSVPEVLDNGFYVGTFFGGAVFTTIHYYIPFKFKIDTSYKNSIYSMDSSNSITYSDFQIAGRTIKENSPYVTLISNLFGDIAPYTDSELYRFVRANSILGPSPIKEVTPKAQFTTNNFYGMGFNSQTYTASIVFDTSYQRKIDSNIIPFYDSYFEFYKNIDGTLQNASVLPEYFITPTGSDLIKVGKVSLDGINGEIYTEYTTSNVYSIDLDKFIDKKSNTINFKLIGSKKLLPYNGFYPQEKIVSIVSDFYNYFDKNRAGLSDYKKVQTLLQPFFAPGILFNTIKSGISVDFPVHVSSSDNSELYISRAESLLDLFSGQTKTGTTFLTHKLPFESILDPISSLKKCLANKTVKVYDTDPSTIIDKTISGDYLKYLDPTRAESYLFSSGSASDYPYVDLKLLAASSNNSYINSINNFLAEIPNFYLKNETLTYFLSKTDDKFGVAEKDKVYKMKIKMKKSSNFSMFQKAVDAIIPIEGLFGPPARTFYGQDGSLKDFTYPRSAYSYFPYTPPYFSEDNVGDGARTIEFVYIGDGKQFDITKVHQINTTGSDGILIKKYLGARDQTIASPETFDNASYYNIMHIDSCMNLFGIIDSSARTYNTITGEPTVTTYDGNSSKRWIIQTKFETPLINFSEVPALEQINGFDSSISGAWVQGINTGPATIHLKGYYSSVNGIWNTYGTIPEDNNSIQIELYEPPLQENERSLLKLCGFKEESKSIGVLADSKIISEAVLLIPYLEKDISNLKLFKIQKSLIVRPDDYLIQLDRKMISGILGVQDYSDKTIQQIKEILDTKPDLPNNSIVDMMKKMVSYNIPVDLNWLYDPTIDPFVMYIFEFTHKLDKQDLADIWQGTMPKIAQNPEIETVEYSHKFGKDELLGTEIRDKMLENRFKARIMKIKKRASTKYSDIVYQTVDSSNQSQEESIIPWYTHNWPYDYFSLVELVNIQQGEGYSEE